MTHTIDKLLDALAQQDPKTPSERFTSAELEKAGAKRLGILPEQLRPFYVLMIRIQDETHAESERRCVEIVGKPGHDHTEFQVDQEMQQDGSYCPQGVADALFQLGAQEHFGVKENTEIGTDWMAYTL